MAGVLGSWLVLRAGRWASWRRLEALLSAWSVCLSCWCLGLADRGTLEAVFGADLRRRAGAQRRGTRFVGLVTSTSAARVGVSLAGGNSVVGKPAGVACDLRAREISIAHGRAIAAPCSARAQLGRLHRAPGRGSCATSWSRTDARCRVRARWLASAATACCCRFRGRQCSEVAVLFPLLAVVRGPAMGGIETRTRAGPGLQRVFTYPRRIHAVSATVVVRSPRSASQSLSVCAVGR